MYWEVKTQQLSRVLPTYSSDEEDVNVATHLSIGIRHVASVPELFASGCLSAQLLTVFSIWRAASQPLQYTLPIVISGIQSSSLMCPLPSVFVQKMRKGGGRL